MVWTLALAAPSHAQTQAVVGQAGILGEWEVSATVTQKTDGGGRRWSGPLSMKHIGFCSTDGPEVKTGELRLQVSDPPGEATATLVIDGTACTFKGRLTNGYDGVLTCPDRRDVPMLLMFE
jgi:hypothetical protein